METQDLIDRIKDLIQLDIDAAQAYGQAISAAEHTQVRQSLTRFRDDHERHISDLSAVLRGFGFEPPEYSQDFKGYLIEGFTYLRSATGTEGALNAMQSNEKLTNRRYEQASKLDLPPDIKGLIDKNFDDERNHLSWIESALSSRIWEQPDQGAGQDVRPGGRAGM